MLTPPNSDILQTRLDSLSSVSSSLASSVKSNPPASTIVSAIHDEERYVEGSEQPIAYRVWDMESNDFERRIFCIILSGS